MKMMFSLNFLLTMGVVGLLAAGPARAGQAAPGAAPAYVNENSTDPAPLKLGSASGTVKGLGKDAMTGVKVSLFTEEGHTLVATVVSDKNGRFNFGKIDKGLYRVVARVDGLCPANIPIRLDASLLEHRKLEITMQPKDIDTCSYGMAKK